AMWGGHKLWGQVGWDGELRQYSWLAEPSLAGTLRARPADAKLPRGSQFAGADELVLSLSG
ncbi:MAG: hypothetical protein ABJJ13_10975, partial [Rhodopirellula bahusiensis]|uniref:hypothetical protein n=1 Tax=Rhodopirellula bahusiensis TaxID=2014065 RepID=UPI0032986CF8